MMRCLKFFASCDYIKTNSRLAAFFTPIERPSMPDDKIQVIADVSSKVTYTGGGTAFLFGFAFNEVIAALGLIVAILGYFTSAYFKREQNKILKNLTAQHREGDIPKALEIINSDSD
jgi:hypothetical protein